MISAVAPPGMPIERGMTASWTQRLVNLGSGNMNKIMIKKNNINKLQASGAIMSPHLNVINKIERNKYGYNTIKKNSRCNRRNLASC